MRIFGEIFSRKHEIFKIRSSAVQEKPQINSSRQQTEIPPISQVLLHN